MYFNKQQMIYDLRAFVISETKDYKIDVSASSEIIRVIDTILELEANGQDSEISNCNIPQVGDSAELTRCKAGRDGECFHKLCPQIKDGEPERSGRHCPIDIDDEWE